MRVKESYIIITFKTTEEAIAMESHCKTCGIPGRLIPIPRTVTAGCGICWRMKPEEYGEYQQELNLMKHEHITEVLM